MEAARPATEADLEVLVAMATVGVAELVPNRGGSIWSRFEARPAPFLPGFQRDLADAETRVLVGTIDSVVVGYGVARLHELHDGNLLSVVGDLFVLEDARGVGVGEAMMNDLVDWSTHKGCVGIDAVALPGDRHTKNFFETFGLVARALTVHRSL